MSNSSLVNYTKISPNKTTPRNHKIDTITIHCVVGQLSVERLGELFAKASYDASSNYGIGADGRIGMYVEEKDRSWCSSDADNDNRAITIECASDTKHPYAINDKVYKSLIELCVDICKRNDIKELKWKGDKSLIGDIDKQNMTVHRWFAAKSCPGDYIYGRLGQIASEVNVKLGVKENESASEVEKYTQEDFVREVQEAINAKVDGDPGPETISKTPTLSAEINDTHKAVKPVQKWLYALGYIEVGKADCEAGPKFTTAVKNFQRDNGCVVDGEITASNKTWRKLLGMPEEEITPKKSIDQIAKEVIAGKWGNGQDRVNKLKKAGDDPDVVQKRVNKLL